MPEVHLAAEVCWPLVPVLFVCREETKGIIGASPTTCYV